MVGPHAILFNETLKIGRTANKNRGLLEDSLGEH